jgi:hypothetical protein
MLTSYETLPAQALYNEVMVPAAEETGFAAVAKSQFVNFFQSKGFTCAADALQQMKATYKKLTVRFSVSDPKIASDQGHAVCYLSFAPLNRRYKIAVSNQAAGKAYTYTLLEDTFSKTGSFNQKSITFYSLEELLNTVFPKASSFSTAITLQSFFSFLF